MLLLQIIIQRNGPAFPVDDTSVYDMINDVYIKACFVRDWSVVRQGASLLGKSFPSMAPCITSLLVCGKQVSIFLFIGSFLSYQIVTWLLVVLGPTLLLLDEIISINILKGHNGKWGP